MRFLVFTLPVLLCAPLQAQTRTVVSDGAAPIQAPIQAPVQTPISKSYETLRRSYRIDAAVTPETVRADVAGNAGRALEIVGRVSGSMTTARGRTVIFDIESGTLNFVLPPEILGADLVSAGQSVRGLFLVSAEDGAAVFGPIAFSSAPEWQEPVNPAVSNAANAIIKAPAKPFDDGVLVMPQGGDMALPDVPPMVRMAMPSHGAREGAPPRMVAPMPVKRTGGNAEVAAYVALARRFNPKLTQGQSNEIGAAIVSASRKYGIDARYLASIIAVESDFDIYCLSSSGAMGLAQLMPFNLRPNGVTNAWNPTQNIHGGAKMLRKSLDEYRGRADATLLATAAYNAGGGAVRRAGYRVPNGKQVQRYVWKVYNQYKAFAPELFASR